MTELLTEPLGQPFMVRALAEITLIGIAAGILGCWVVLYGVSYAAESMAHSVFPGLVLAALAGIPLLAGGIPGIAAAALAITLIARTPGVNRDTAVAIAVTGLFGLGGLLALSSSSPPGVGEILFGDILATTGTDLLLSAALTALIVTALSLLHGRILATGFDPATAGTLGARPALTEFALMLLVALTILVAIQGLGNLLVIAVLAGPAATARLFCSRLIPMMAASCAVGISLGWVGLYLSFHLGTAAGASIALAIFGGFLIAALARGERGLPVRTVEAP